MEKFWILLSTAVLIVSFQNCSNSTDFSATDELISKVSDEGLNTALDTSQDPSVNSDDIIANNDDVVTPPSNITSPSDVTPPPAIPPVATLPSSDTENDDSVVTPPSPEVTSPSDVTPPPIAVAPPAVLPDTGDDSLSGPLEFVCVLRSHGKSAKIGVIGNSALGGKTGTPGDVCMSENACLNILSEKFDVVGAEKRGFCPDKNPNVVSMTDAQIEAALAKAELLASLK